MSTSIYAEVDRLVRAADEHGPITIPAPLFDAMTDALSEVRVWDTKQHKTITLNLWVREPDEERQHFVFRRRIILRG